MNQTAKKGPRGLLLADGHDDRTGMCPARGHRGPAPAEGRGQGAHGAGVRVVEPARSISYGLVISCAELTVYVACRFA